MLKTQAKIKEFLEMANKKKENMENSINKANGELNSLIGEKQKLISALAEAELNNDTELLDRIGKEIDIRINKINILNQKIESFINLKANFPDEIEDILRVAAKEYNEDSKTERGKIFDSLAKARAERDELKKKLDKKEEEIKSLNWEDDRVKGKYDCMYDCFRGEILEYMPEEFRTAFKKYNHDYRELQNFAAKYLLNIDYNVPKQSSKSDSWLSKLLNIKQ